MSTALEIEDLHYRYPDGTVALRGVNIIIEENQCVGLIGPNGAGKSTLLHHLNGLLPEQIQDKQPIRILGKQLTPNSLLDIRRKVGLVFQDANDQLFCPTVYEDVAFGPRQQLANEQDIAERVAAAIKRAGLEGLENRPPHHLSGGQKRRACLAGVLACEPEILLLDEPSADLDPRGRRELKELLTSLKITRIIATRDLELVAEICDMVIVMDNGQVASVGEPRVTLANQALMDKYGLEVPYSLRSPVAPVAPPPASTEAPPTPPAANETATKDDPFSAPSGDPFTA